MRKYWSSLILMILGGFLAGLAFVANWLVVLVSVTSIVATVYGYKRFKKCFQ